MKKILVIIFALVVLVLLGIYFKESVNVGSSPTVREIILTEDGFKPEEITIKKGGTITFKTTGDQPFWPASDIHPTHGIYPEFDPQDAIMPDKTWSYKFDKIGEWSFHDHIAPYFTGKIKVVE